MDQKVLANYSETERLEAMKKYEIIAPYLKSQETVQEISLKRNISLRTLYDWIRKYSLHGLVGLVRKQRTDKNTYRISKDIVNELDYLMLKYKTLAISSMHRKIATYCQTKKENALSYKQVYKYVKRKRSDMGCQHFFGQKIKQVGLLFKLNLESHFCQGTGGDFFAWHK